MRKSMRLAAPAIAASAALLLTACGSDDDGDGGATAGQLPGGDEGGDGNGDGAGGDGGGEAPSSEELSGAWQSGSVEDGSVLVFMDGSVSYLPDASVPEGGCGGTVSEGTLSVQCYSSNWTATEAQLSLDGETLNAVWDDGTEQVYEPAGQIPGLEELEDMGDMGADMGDMGDMDLQELEDLQDELQQELDNLENSTF